jgi:hypothetical protein
LPAIAAPEVSDSEAAVREAVSRFRAAVREGTCEALLPTVTAADGRMIQERSSLKLPLFRVEDLAGFFAEASSRARRDAARPGPEFNVTLADADHARLDVEPLLSFRHPVYLVREDGGWKVDLTLTLRRSREPRPKEEIISICRQALRGIAEDADLVETKHFLIFAHTGPVPAQQAAQLLEELYDNFQQVFPFDLGISPPAEPPSPDASGETAGAPIGEPRAALPYPPGSDPYMIVFLFSYHQEYLKFAEQYDPGAMESGGYATPTGYCVVWFSSLLRPTVRHEGTHLLMFRRMHLFGELARGGDGGNNGRSPRGRLRGEAHSGNAAEGGSVEPRTAADEGEDRLRDGLHALAEPGSFPPRRSPEGVGGTDRVHPQMVPPAAEGMPRGAAAASGHDSGATG